jgi:hypothetical protein
MSGESGSRAIRGIEAPGAGRWEIDPGHTSVAFVARYLMVTKVRGHFSEFSGAIHVAERPQESWAELVIRASELPGLRQRLDPLRHLPLVARPLRSADSQRARRSQAHLPPMPGTRRTPRRRCKPHRRVRAGRCGAPLPTT